MQFFIPLFQLLCSDCSQRACGLTVFRQWSGAALVLLAYDVSNADSFRRCEQWAELLADSFGHRKARGVLVGCKADLRDAAQVPSDAAREFAHEHGLQPFECSAVRYLSDAVAPNHFQSLITTRNDVLFPLRCPLLFVVRVQFEGKDVDTPFNFLADLFHRSYESKLKLLNS
jgi:hypothetical protein